MYRTQIHTITDVVTSGLCSSCGACAGLAPETLKMVVFKHEGRRPLLRAGTKKNALSGDLMAACPGWTLALEYNPQQPGLVQALAPAWGPVLGI